MQNKQFLAFATFSFLAASAASAVTIDTSGDWDGNINFGWFGSGQSLTVEGDSSLVGFSFYFDAAAAGQTFTFSINDALSGGTTLYMTDFVVAAGENSFSPDVALSDGSTIYATVDYNGYSGSSAHFIETNVYAGGNSFFLPSVGAPDSFPGLDHRFKANFDESVSAIPLPAGALLLLTALGASAVLKSRRET